MVTSVAAQQPLTVTAVMGAQTGPKIQVKVLHRRVLRVPNSTYLYNWMRQAGGVQGSRGAFSVNLACQEGALFPVGGKHLSLDLSRAGSRGVAPCPQGTSCESLQVGRSWRLLRVYSSSSSRSYRQGEPFIGRKAEDFPLTVAGRPARLSEFRGKVVVLNFWHLGVVPAWKRCQTWTVFRRGSARVVVLS